jgi:hypothetical protein
MLLITQDGGLKILIVPHATKEKEPTEGEDNSEQREGYAKGEMQMRREYLRRDETGVKTDKKRKAAPDKLSVICVPPGGHLI